ncbi:MAG: hypothetical protein AB7S26_04630 [Sandaracinaceae bacterium]
MDSTDQILGLVKIAVIFGAIFILPIGGLIAFTQLRAKARKSALAGPWTQLAQGWGGQLVGERVVVNRPDHQLTVEMKMVSIMDAASGPYYPDGGTFTVAKLALNPHGPARITTTPPARVVLEDLHQRCPATATLLPRHRVILGPTEAAVVLDGAVSDPAAIDAALRGLVAIHESTQRGGPLTITPAA